MKGGAAFATVAILLGASVLLNIALLTRSRPPDPEPQPQRPMTQPVREAAVSPVPPAGVYTPVHEVPVARPVASAPASVATRAPAAPSRPVTYFDPSIEAVLDAQDKFGGFWKDLDRVFKAKDRLDETRYFNAVVGSTQEFLELGDPTRGHFAQATQNAVAEMARARKEREDAKKLLPPKDKANPAALAVYNQQKDAIDARYDERVKDAQAAVTGLLDQGRARHAEFSAHADRWLKNLVPKSAIP